MYLREATQRLLLDAEFPIITEYDLFVLATTLLADGSYQGERIRRPPQAWDAHRCRALIRRLEYDRVLIADDDFRAGVWRVVQSSASSSTEDACCLVDPFCYVSHLSAMSFYGLIEELPQQVYITTPQRSVWRHLRDTKMEKDLAAVPPGLEAPILTRIGFKSRVRKREVSVHETKHPVSPTAMSQKGARVTPIGHVFIGMLEEPRLCGGMSNILQVWRTHAANHLDAIIGAGTGHSSKIARVRAGYVIEDELGLRDPQVNQWVKDAQRGGSRKLDPDQPYAPRFSERWMLSLNV